MALFYSYVSTVLKTAVLQCLTAESDCISIIRIVPEHTLKRMGEMTMYIRSFLTSILSSYPIHVIEV
jgi:hypothetical protein